MCAYKVASKAVPGPVRSGVTVHVSADIRLYFYPADDGTEKKEEPELLPNGKFGPAEHTYGFGTIYVMRGRSVLKAYPARGGPKETFKGKDLHIHSPIPPRTYVLGAAVQYTTRNWANSSIPWGAKIRRAANGEIQFDSGSGWQYATGSPTAPMTQACRREFIRWNRKQPNPAELVDLDRKAKAAFDVDPVAPKGILVDVWDRNDFGAWSFSLQCDGTTTGFFIHTTPDDEIATEEGRIVHLDSSHGCIHMRPADRNEAKNLGYLKKGQSMQVLGFDAKGPPV